ncbi:MAG: STAS/SEC14 domain-containing protein [Desulfobacteraceae bacterium]|jgi:hypothetical protein
MFEYIQKIQGNVLAIKINGEMTEEEHQELDALFRERISKWGRLRVFVVAMHYPSFNSAEALFEDLRMVKRHAESIDRLAVVADRSWKRTWIGIFGLFSRIPSDFYEMDEIEAAWQWIAEGLNTTAPS